MKAESDLDLLENEILAVSQEVAEKEAAAASFLNVDAASFLPIMWSIGAGADVMKRIAAPMIGGLATSFLLELLIYPVVFYIWKERTYFSRNASSMRSNG